MFKSKTDFKAFDKNNEKVHLEMPKVKTLAKAGVKKLAAKPEERTPFHLVLNYFEDDNEKAVGDFLDFGIQKRLSKHFLQVEMKPGKPDKRLSANPKEASMGEAFVKVEGGKRLVCFEPHPASKIPNGKWPKILKGLKALLAGMKGVLVIGGEVVGETLEAGEEATAENTDAESTGEATDAAPATETEAATEEAPPVDAASIKAMVGAISKGLKETLPKDIIPKVRARTAERADQEIVQELLDQFESFSQTFESAADAVQEKLRKMYDIAQKQQPQVQRILNAIQNLLSSRAPDGAADEATSDDVASTPEEDRELAKLLALAETGIAQFDKDYTGLKKDLEASSDEPIEGGEALLSQLA